MTDNKALEIMNQFDNLSNPVRDYMGKHALCILSIMEKEGELPAWAHESIQLLLGQLLETLNEKEAD